MKFECPHCHQHLESGASMAGTPIRCPACNGDLLIPAVAESGTPASAEESLRRGAPAEAAARSALQQSLQSSIDRGGRSLHQVMADKHIEADVELEPGSAPEDGATPGRDPGFAPQDEATPRHGEDVAGAVKQALPASAEESLRRGTPGGEQASRYQVGDLVAQGGMGAILTARDVNLRRSVAMKVMLDPAQARQQHVLRFIEEAQVTGQLEHPGVVPVYELGAGADGQVFYTMKFVKGQTLRDILKGIADGDAGMVENYPLSRLLTIYQKVCDALAFAHSKRVVHRDLKPENIMVGDYGEVLVMDWGLAKVLPRKAVRRIRLKGKGPSVAPAAEGGGAMEGAPADSAGAVESVRGDAGGEVLKTMTGSIMGTPGFMAPEQAEGRIEQIDERSDVYALGAILYQVLTLRPPIQGKDVVEILGKISTGQIPHPSTYNPKTTKRRRVETSESAFGGVAAVPSPKDRRPGEIDLLHLPDQRVPDSLSAVAMKALKTNAAERYQSVPELQKDIEAFQTGFATGAEEAGLGRQMALLVRRHKGIFTALAASVVVVAAVVGVAFMRVNTERRTAVAALSSFRVEQAQRQADRKASAPSLIRSAKGFIEQGDMPAARTLVDTALEYDPEQAEALLLKSILCMEAADYAGAEAQSAKYLERYPGDPEGRALRKVADVALKQGATNAPRSMVAGLLVKHGLPNLAVKYSVSIGALLPEYRRRLEAIKPGLSANLVDKGDGTLSLDLVGIRELVSLKPLEGMPLSWLRVNNCLNVDDLSPLKGMPLRALSIEGSPVKDLSPLKGMPLTHLNMMGTPVHDLKPLAGLALTNLQISGTSVSDLTPLKGMPLTVLWCHGTRVSDLTPLVGMPLISLGLGVWPDKWGPAPVTDLSPLRGMPLVSLNIQGTKVSDLTPLAGMPLSAFWLTSTQVTNLTPLKGMQFPSLDLAGLQVSDLSPLKGMPLTTLFVYGTRVSDLTPLKGMRLQCLCLAYKGYGCAVTDLSPLKGMPLTELYVDGTRINDWSPLRGMKTLAALYGWDPLEDVRSKLCAAMDRGDLDSILREVQKVKADLDGYADMPVFTNALTLARNMADVTLPTLIAIRKGPSSIPSSVPAFGGHHYLYVSFPMTWPQATNFCEKSGGHLATITSPEEQAFAATLLPPAFFCWLGGVVDGKGEWTWVTKEPWGFSNWLKDYPGESGHPYLGMWGECPGVRHGEWSRFRTTVPYPCPLLMEWDR